MGLARLLGDVLGLELSMVPEISDTVMFLTKDKDIWDALNLIYSKVRDATQIYEIRTKVVATKQGTKFITEYANL